jgi:hypothetical protein
MVQRIRRCRKKKRMTGIDGRATVLSPVSTAIHELDLPVDSPVWRDNAFLLFWDPATDVYGSAHVATSPNGEGRRARFSLAVAGEVVEIVEPLTANSFASESITFDVAANRVTVQTPEVAADLNLVSRFAVADYAGGGIFPSLRPDAPIHHYQQGLSVVGAVRLHGRDIAVDARGLRDRTWGFRDEAVSMQEYVALVAVFGDHTLTVVRMLAADGTDRTEGYRLTNSAEPLDYFGVTRDAAGFFVDGSISGPGTPEFTVTADTRRGGFWVPMGATRRGPAIRAYDEFVSLKTSDGQEGFGVVEQAVVLRLF